MPPYFSPLIYSVGQDQLEKSLFETLDENIHEKTKLERKPKGFHKGSVFKWTPDYCMLSAAITLTTFTFVKTFLNYLHFLSHLFC